MLVPTFVEVAGKKLVGGSFYPLLHPHQGLTTFARGCNRFWETFLTFHRKDKTIMIKIFFCNFNIVDWVNTVSRFVNIDYLVIVEKLLWDVTAKCNQFVMTQKSSRSAAFNLLFKLIDFENSVNVAVVNGRRKLSVLTILLKVALQHNDAARKRKKNHQKKKIKIKK